MAEEFDGNAAIHFPDDTQGEERRVTISIIGLTLYVMVHVERGEKIRIIGL